MVDNYFGCLTWISVTQEIPLTLEALVQRVNKLCTVVEELVALVQHDINATDSTTTWICRTTTRLHGQVPPVTQNVPQVQKEPPRGSAHSKTLIRYVHEIIQPYATAVWLQYQDMPSGSGPVSFVNNAANVGVLRLLLVLMILLILLHLLVMPI